MPTGSDCESMDICDLKQVIDSLEQEDSPPSTEPVIAPSAKKLEKNALSEDAVELLRIGRRKDALVEKLLAGLPRPESGEQIAEAFRHHYQRLSSEGLSPDEVSCEPYQRAGSSQVVLPRREVAVLAV